MEESSAPPIEEDGQGHGQRTLMMNTNYGWGIPGYSAPSTGNPYPPQFPPPYYTPPMEPGLYPNIGYGYPPPATVPPPYQGAGGVRPFMQCPICRERLMKPIYQCQNGHVICNTCIDRYEFCTECRASLAGPKIRNMALEKIIKENHQATQYAHPPWEMTEVRCPNSGDGCQVVTSSSGIGSHLEVCEFRPVPFCSKILGWSQCYSEVNSNSIIGHLRDHHENQIVEKEETRFSLRLVLPNNAIHGAALGPGLIWDPILVTALDIPALIKCAVSPNGNLLINGYLLGGSIYDTKNYRVKYELNSSAKTSRLEWTGSLLSFRHHHSDHLPNVNTLRIPIQTLKEFFKDYEDDSQSRLNIRVCLWKIGDDYSPFRECFRNTETWEKDPLDKTIVIGVPIDESHSFSFNDTIDIGPSPSSYSSTNILSTSAADVFATTSSPCTNCTRPLYGVCYQCLQCPAATYFCRHCIEARNIHGEHLTLRISNAEQHIPLAAVVYECASGEIS